MTIREEIIEYLEDHNRKTIKEIAKEIKKEELSQITHEADFSFLEIF